MSYIHIPTHIQFILFFFRVIYLFLAVPGLHCCMGLFLVAVTRASH